ncbi:MAG: hypothetical protein PHW04_17535 [Candidatus Wallbacteria bacterium]|nr:hypothetical protein [Candidatus Wallbacteria bacterium]
MNVLIGLFYSMGTVNLPFFTRMIIELNDFLGCFRSLTFMIALYFLYRVVKILTTKDSLIRFFPFFGTINRDLAMLRFLSGFCETALGQAIPKSDLQRAASTLENKYLGKKLLKTLGNASDSMEITDFLIKTGLYGSRDINRFQKIASQPDALIPGIIGFLENRVDHKLHDPAFLLYLITIFFLIPAILLILTFFIPLYRIITMAA